MAASSVSEVLLVQRGEGLEGSETLLDIQASEME